MYISELVRAYTPDSSDAKPSKSFRTSSWDLVRVGEESSAGGEYRVHTISIVIRSAVLSALGFNLGA